MRAVFTDTAHGAITQLFAGTAPQALELNGEVSPYSSPPLSHYGVLQDVE